MAAFKSPFEKLSFEAQDSMAKSLNPGGPLYSLLERLVIASETVSTGGVVSGGGISKEALVAIEGLGLASKRLAGSIAIIAAAKPADIEKFFGLFAQLRKTLLEDLPEKDMGEMLRRSTLLGVVSDGIARVAVTLAEFAALTPVALFGAVSLMIITRIIGQALTNLTGGIIRQMFGVKREDSLLRVGEGILLFGKSLALFAIASPLIKFGAKMLFQVVEAVTQSLSLLAEGTSEAGWFGRRIRGKRGVYERGLRLMRRMAFAISIFAMVMSFSTPLLGIGIIGAAALALIIRILAGTPGAGFLALGDNANTKTIGKGILNLALMGIGLALFAPAALILAGLGVLSVLVILGAFVLSVTLRILVPAFGALGKGAAQIAQGALMLALIGISLIPLGIGIMFLANSFSSISSPWEFFGWSTAIIGALSLIFTGIGLAVAASAGTALLGPALVAAIGGSLIALGIGLVAFKNAKWTEEDSSNLATALAGIKAAFMGTDGESSGGFFDKVKGALKGAVDSAKIIAAAAGYAAAGLALQSLSKGLIRFQEVGWTKEKTEVLTEALAGIAGAFAAIGGQDQVAQGGFLGSVFGLKTSKTEEGIRSVIDSGEALTSIATGLKAFEKLYQTINFGEADSEGKYAKGTMGYAIVNTMAFVSAAFAQVADQGNVKAGGILGIFGVENNKVEEGIRAVQGSGDALKGIVDGLTGFQALVKKQINWEELGKTISFTISFVSKAFASVVDQGSVQQGGFFGSLLGIEQNKVKEGIESVSGVGVELKGIADGLVTFQELIKQEISWEELGNTISKSIGFVSEAFAAVADKGKTQQSGFWGTLFSIQTSKVSEGVESVMGAQDALNGIADGLNKFQGLENPDKAAENIKFTLGIVGEAFSEAAIKGKDLDYDDLQNTMKTAANMYERISKSSNEMNIEAIATTARMFEALGYLSEQGGETAIEQLGQSLVDAIAELADMIANFEGSVNDAAASNDGLGDKIGGFISSLNPFKSDESQGASSIQTTPSSGGGAGAGASLNVNQEELIAEIKRLQSILVSGDAVVQVETGLI